MEEHWTKQLREAIEVVSDPNPQQENGVTTLAQTLEKIADGWLDSMALDRKLRERELDLRERELELEEKKHKSYVPSLQDEGWYREDDDIPF